MEYLRLFFDWGLRPIPLYHPFDGCHCYRESEPGQCFDPWRGYHQCIGKVPQDSKWADKEYTIEDFKHPCNLALAMGK